MKRGDLVRFNVEDYGKKFSGAAAELGDTLGVVIDTFSDKRSGRTLRICVVWWLDEVGRHMFSEHFELHLTTVRESP